MAECLIVAQNANEEEMALLEEETDNLRPLSSSVAQEQSWRASTYLGDPIDSSTRPNPRKQFHNLVHVWAETGESSTSGPNGRTIQRRKENLAPARAPKPKDSEPTYASKEHPNLWKPDKPDQTVPGKGIWAALTKLRQARVPTPTIFSGDLYQLSIPAEQGQPESESKADAIRGAAAIVRRFSIARQEWEIDEIKRLHAEKQADLEPVQDGEHIEWDGLRRRRTTYGTLNDISKGPWVTEEERLGLVRGSIYEQRENGS